MAHVAHAPTITARNIACCVRAETLPGDTHASALAHARDAGGRASLVTASIVLGVVYAGSPLVTPLYPLYQHAFGLSELTVTLVYAAYVIGNLGALFAFGRVSDRAGRRFVNLFVLAVAIVSTLLFLFATHPAWLYVAWAASGLAIGVGAATATAGIAELHPASDKAAASRLAAAVNLAGLAAGALTLNRSPA